MCVFQRNGRTQNVLSIFDQQIPGFNIYKLFPCELWFTFICLKVKSLITFQSHIDKLCWTPAGFRFHITVNNCNNSTSVS